MQFGDQVLLNTRWQFGVILLLSVRGQFWQPLIAQTGTIELVAFIGLEGVNYVSHMFLLF
jgi:hypothetical protein